MMTDRLAKECLSYKGKLSGNVTCSEYRRDTSDIYTVSMPLKDIGILASVGHLRERVDIEWNSGLMTQKSNHITKC